MVAAAVPNSPGYELTLWQKTQNRVLLTKYIDCRDVTRLCKWNTVTLNSPLWHNFDTCLRLERPVSSLSTNHRPHLVPKHQVSFYYLGKPARGFSSLGCPQEERVTLFGLPPWGYNDVSGFSLFVLGGYLNACSFSRRLAEPVQETHHKKIELLRPPYIFTHHFFFFQCTFSFLFSIYYFFLSLSSISKHHFHHQA